MPLAALTVVGYVMTLLDRLPNLIASGMNLTTTFANAKKKMTQFEQEKREPTQQEWDQLDAELNELEKQLQSAHRDPAPGG